MNNDNLDLDIEDFKAVVEKAGGKPTSDQVYDFAKSQAELFETQAKKMQSGFEEITREIEAEIVIINTALSFKQQWIRL